MHESSLPGDEQIRLNLKRRRKHKSQYNIQNLYVELQHWLLYSTSINRNCHNMKLEYNVGC